MAVAQLKSNCVTSKQIEMVSMSIPAGASPWFDNIAKWLWEKMIAAIRGELTRAKIQVLQKAMSPILEDGETWMFRAFKDYMQRNHDATDEQAVLYWPQFIMDIHSGELVI